MTKLILVYLSLTMVDGEVKVEEGRQAFPGYVSISACQSDIDRAVSQPRGPDMIVVGAYCEEAV